MSYGQVEIYSHGSTHTIHETCGHSNCNEKILEALGVGEERYSDAYEFEVGEATITVRDHLGESDSCVWCYGCGDFLRHANASPRPDGSYFGCRCGDPKSDREPMEPMVDVNGSLELRPFK
ncbi:hypothetical protein ABT282_07280 [Streptomyces sp. NPDC000927]|uniref:hypothetical protein n=1 Tax=Streptomyces sp. NPDC000927 TaxID=3154371 RepID=UPI003324BDEA